jgi:hypothetical protein
MAPLCTFARADSVNSKEHFTILHEYVEVSDAVGKENKFGINGFTAPLLDS